MTKEEMFGNMIALGRQAPLRNMEHAEAVAKLLQEFAAYAKQELDGDAAKAEIAEQMQHEAGQELPPE